MHMKSYGKNIVKITDLVTVSPGQLNLYGWQMNNTGRAFKAELQESSHFVKYPGLIRVKSNKVHSFTWTLKICYSRTFSDLSISYAKWLGLSSVAI